MAKAPAAATAARTRGVDSRAIISITPREAFSFVQSLAGDDDFREAFEKDPSEILASVHIYLPPESIPEDVKLPSKAELQEVLANITLGQEFQFAPPAAAVFIAFLAFLAFFRK